MLDHLPGLPWLSSWSAALVLASALAWWLARRRARALGLDPSHLDLALPLAFVAGASCASLLDRLVPGELELAGPALVTGGRMRIAAVAPVFVAVLIGYARLARLPARALADAVAIPGLLWMALVRVGCFLGGCCFGDVCGHADRVAGLTDGSLRLQLQRLPLLSGEGFPLAVRFPAGSLVQRQHLVLGLVAPGDASLPVHPVQLYEAGAVLLLALALHRARPRLGGPGSEALAALGGYAAIAFLMELLRADNALVLGPLTANQLHYAAWGVLALALALAAHGRRAALRPT